MADKKTGGLAGIVAGDSAICTCGKEDQSLRYRGYSIEDLAANASFEEVAWLLLRGELPTTSQFAQYREKLAKLRDLPQGLKEILERIPQHTHMMDVLRTGCSALGNFEPEEEGHDAMTIADRLIACFPSILLYWYHFHQGHGTRINLNTGEESLAGHFLTLLHGQKPQETHRRCMDASLILYAEHEFNASTFTARTIASTLSDFYSAVTGAIGALRGSLHGGANEWAMYLIENFNDPDHAEAGVLHRLQHKQLIMGFGHRVYTTSDPRSAIIKEWSRKMAEGHPDHEFFPISERIERVMWREKKLFPNLDFYSAAAYHFLRIPTPMFTPIFVFSRISGWAAHILEQRGNNKLIRPVSRYTGPGPRSWLPIEKRSENVHSDR